jgi:hypothetical protein
MCEPTEVDVRGLDDAALGALVVELQAQAERLEAARLRVLGEWDARAVWALDGAANGASWLAARGDVARGPTAGLLRDAGRLRSMPETSEALAEGRLAPATARLMARALNERTAAAFARDEAVLIDTLGGLSVDDAAQVLRWWQRSVDADGPDPRDRDANGVWLSQGLGGRWHLKGELDTESGTILSGVLAGLVEHDRRIRRQAGEDLTGKAPQLRAEALVEMARRATAAGDHHPAARPLVWVLAGEEHLRTGSGACELAGGGAVSAALARRLACDADIQSVVVDADGRINLGRTQRSAGATQRRLLWLRDRGCRFPGCDRPPGWTEAHHIWFWEDGGPTDLDNLCLLCSRHHHLCHEGGFRCRRDEGRELVFHRPDGSLLEPPLVTA